MASENKKVKFHMPGLRGNLPLNLMMVSLLETYPEYFREGVAFASFFGEFPTSLWASGRFTFEDQCDADFIRLAIQSVNDLGIPVRFTYTNPTITKEELSDPYCNFCLQVGDNGMNEVLVTSDILEEYIRKNYPKYTINSSTCKCLRTLEEVEAELAKDYGLVVLDYNLNHEMDTISKLSDKDRIEILVNPCCQPNCPRRKAHYAHIGQLHRQVLENRKLPPEKQTPLKTWYCDFGEKNTIFDVLDYPTVISPEEIWNVYVPMGFSNFKIEGRTGNLYNLVETYVFYLIKPEYQGRARILLYTNLESSGVLRHVKPRRGQWP